MNLHDGDSVQFGSFRFRFVDRSAKRASVKPKVCEPAALEVDGSVDPLPINHRVTVIGRRADCEISLIEASVSTVHAVIFEINGDRYIRDLGSRTGTHVNGEPVHQQKLQVQDKIRIGETNFRYIPGDAAETADSLDELEDLVGTAALGPENSELPGGQEEHSDPVLGLGSTSDEADADPPPRATAATTRAAPGRGSTGRAKGPVETQNGHSDADGDVEGADFGGIDLGGLDFEADSPANAADTVGIPPAQPSAKRPPPQLAPARADDSLAMPNGYDEPGHPAAPELEGLDFGPIDIEPFDLDAPLDGLATPHHETRHEQTAAADDAAPAPSLDVFGEQHETTASATPIELEPGPSADAGLSIDVFDAGGAGAREATPAPRQGGAAASPHAEPLEDDLFNGHAHEEGSSAGPIELFAEHAAQPHEGQPHAPADAEPSVSDLASGVGLGSDWEAEADLGGSPSLIGFVPDAPSSEPAAAAKMPGGKTESHGAPPSDVSHAGAPQGGADADVFDAARQPTVESRQPGDAEDFGLDFLDGGVEAGGPEEGGPEERRPAEGGPREHERGRVEDDSPHDVFSAAEAEELPLIRGGPGASNALHHQPELPREDAAPALPPSAVVPSAVVPIVEATGESAAAAPAKRSWVSSLFGRKTKGPPPSSGTEAVAPDAATPPQPTGATVAAGAGIAAAAVVGAAAAAIHEKHVSATVPPPPSPQPLASETGHHAPPSKAMAAAETPEPIEEIDFAGLDELVAPDDQGPIGEDFDADTDADADTGTGTGTDTGTVTHPGENADELEADSSEHAHADRPSLGEPDAAAEAHEPPPAVDVAPPPADPAAGEISATIAVAEHPTDEAVTHLPPPAQSTEPALPFAEEDEEPIDLSEFDLSELDFSDLEPSPQDEPAHVAAAAPAAAPIVASIVAPVVAPPVAPRPPTDAAAQSVADDAIDLDAFEVEDVVEPGHAFSLSPLTAEPPTRTDAPADDHPHPSAAAAVPEEPIDLGDLELEALPESEGLEPSPESASTPATPEPFVSGVAPGHPEAINVVVATPVGTGATPVDAVATPINLDEQPDLLEEPIDLDAFEIDDLFEPDAPEHGVAGDVNEHTVAPVARSLAEDAPLHPQGLSHAGAAEASSEEAGPEAIAEPAYGDEGETIDLRDSVVDPIGAPAPEATTSAEAEAHGASSATPVSTPEHAHAAGEWVEPSAPQMLDAPVDSQSVAEATPDAEGTPELRPSENAPASVWHDEKLFAAPPADSVIPALGSPLGPEPVPHDVPRRPTRPPIMTRSSRWRFWNRPPITGRTASSLKSRRSMRFRATMATRGQSLPTASPTSRAPRAAARRRVRR